MDGWFPVQLDIIKQISYNMISHIDGLVQDCSNIIADALESL